MEEDIEDIVKNKESVESFTLRQRNGVIPRVRKRKNDVC